MATDGFSESQNSAGVELGIDAFVKIAQQHHVASAAEMVEISVKTAADYRGGVPASDDLTVLVLERSA